MAFLALEPHRRPAIDIPLQDLVDRVTAELPWHHREMVRLRDRRWMPAAWRTAAVQAQLALWDHQSQAARDLKKLGTNAWPAVPQLLNALARKPYPQGIHVAQLLAEIHADQHPAWTSFQPILDGRHAAAKTFHQLAVHGALNPVGDDLRRRQFCLVGLAATGHAAEAYLTNLVDLAASEADPGLRIASLNALAALRHSPKAPIDPLIRLIDNTNEWPLVSAAAVLALPDRTDPDGQLTAILRSATGDRRGDVRLAAAQTLWRRKAPAAEVLSVLRPLLHHRRAALRAGALEALRAMGPAAEECRPEIQRLASDDNDAVRQAARAALAAIPSITGPSP